MLNTLKAIEEDAVVPEAQEDAAASEAPKVFFDQNELDFNQPTETLYNFIRGMSPYPGTWTRYENKILKIYFAEPFSEVHSNPPGQIVTDYKNYLRIYTADGFLEITDLQWEGKRRMSVRDFLNGLKSQ